MDQIVHYVIKIITLQKTKQIMMNYLVNKFNNMLKLIVKNILYKEIMV